MQQQGTDLAFLIDELVAECDLPPGRNLTICAWSLGNAFLFNTLTAIELVERDVRDRLSKRVKGVILWGNFILFKYARPLPS